MSTNVPYHLSTRKLHTMSTISPNLLQTAYNVYDLPQPASLYAIPTIFTNQQQTAYNRHNHPQPTTDSMQCSQSCTTNYIQHTMSTNFPIQLQTAFNVYNHPQTTTYNIQCPQSPPTNNRLNTMSTICHNQLQMAYNVKTPRFPRSTDRMQCQQTHPPNHSHCSQISPTISSTINGIQSHDSFSSISPNIPPTIDCIQFPHSLPTAPHKLPMHVCSSIIANYRGNTMTTISPNHSSNYICMQYRQSLKIFLKLHTA